MFVGFYTGLIPRKPQNPSIFGTLTASRHLILGKNLEIKIWNIFSNHIDHFKGVPKKSLNYSPPLPVRDLAEERLLEEFGARCGDVYLQRWQCYEIRYSAHKQGTLPSLSGENYIGGEERP